MVFCERGRAALSIDADRAARRIVRAVERGDRRLVYTLPAQEPSARRAARAELMPAARACVMLVGMRDGKLSRADRVTLRRVLWSVVPSLLAVSCGTSPTTSDGGTDAAPDSVVGCGGCQCEGGASVFYATSYDVCPSDDAGLDASDAAASDADAASDAGTCYASCDYACAATAPAGTSSVCVGEDDAGVARVAQCRADSFPCTGRRTAGLDEPSGATRALGATLARYAWLEAASVHAFRRLARELRAYGAPAELVCAARASARDEIRHARAMRSLARTHGARVEPVAARADGVRDLETIARENAVEACVTETFGALLAAWQAERAEDAGVRAAMRAIAPDEVRHASLAWAVAAWIEPRLSPAARARVRRARADAARKCVQNATNELGREIAGPLGLPSAAAARSLACGLARGGVWPRAA